jgi:hypothetical protein
MELRGSPLASTGWPAAGTCAWCRGGWALGSPSTTAALPLSLSGPFAARRRRGPGRPAVGTGDWRRVDACRRPWRQAGRGRGLHRLGRPRGPAPGPLRKRPGRAVAPLVRQAGRLLCNYGGSADDLAQPGVVCPPAPASSYLVRLLWPFWSPARAARPGSPGARTQPSPRVFLHTNRTGSKAAGSSPSCCWATTCR